MNVGDIVRVRGTNTARGWPLEWLDYVVAGKDGETYWLRCVAGDYDGPDTDLVVHLAGSTGLAGVVLAEGRSRLGASVEILKVGAVVLG